MVRPGPYSILSRCKNSLGVQGVLDLFVELHLGVIVEIVGVGNLVHHGQMCSIFAPSVFSTVINECADEPQCPSLGFGVLAVEYYADNVICIQLANQLSQAKFFVVSSRQGLNLRISLIPTTKSQIASNPASSQRFLVI